MASRIANCARYVCAAAWLAVLSACQLHVGQPGEGPQAELQRASADAHSAGASPEALDLTALSNLEGILPQLAQKRIVFVGEVHNRYDHHLNQLDIIRGIHARHPDLAIGMEAFQQPFQAALDAYLAGAISEQEMLRQTEYYDRWKFDYRLYAPILRFARERRIPVVALNVPTELTTKVGREGPESLTATERASLPQDMDRSDPVYRERLQAIYASHPHGEASDFEHFLEVQLLWDEGMAERAARYLEAHPGRRMVVLAGRGHLAYGSGIPKRLTRRIDAATAIVLNGWEGPLTSDVADFLLFSAEKTLPPSGRLGLFLTNGDGAIRVREFVEDSAGESAGMRKGDHLLSLDGERIAGMADLRVAMWNKRPGDTVQVVVRRSNPPRADEDLAFEVVLR